MLSLPQVPGNGLIPKDFSATQSLLENGAKSAASDSSLKKVGAHTIYPAGSALSIVIDTLAHLVATLVTTVTYVPKMAVWLVSFGKVDMAKEATIGRIVQHVGRTVGWVAMLPVVPLLSVASCNTALSVIKGMGLVGGGEDINAKGFWNKLKNAEGLGGKWNVIKAEPKVTAKAIASLPFQAGKKGLGIATEQTKKHPYLASAAVTAGIGVDQIQAWYRGQQSIAQQGVLKAWEHAGWQGVDLVKDLGASALSYLPSISIPFWSNVDENVGTPPVNNEPPVVNQEPPVVNQEATA